MIEAKIEGFRTEYGTDGLFINVHLTKLLRDVFALSNVDLSSSGKSETPEAKQADRNE